MFGRLSAWWENMGPRERRLASLLGATLVLCGLIYAGLSIQEGLSELEQSNNEMRVALQSLDDHKDDLAAAKTKDGEAVAMIGEEALPLASYLEKIGGEVGVQIRAQTKRPTTQKGKFHEVSVQITLFDVTLEQLASFLKKIETTSQIVVTQRVYVKRNSIAKEKMDRVEITVATYERGAAKAGAAAKAGDKEKAAEPKTDADGTAAKPEEGKSP